MKTSAYVIVKRATLFALFLALLAVSETTEPGIVPCLVVVGLVTVLDSAVSGHGGTLFSTQNPTSLVARLM